jgi:hypothetical protein
MGDAGLSSDRVKEVAIASLAILELYALWRGADGLLFATVIALIAGIAGYKLAIYVRDKT